MGRLGVGGKVGKGGGRGGGEVEWRGGDMVFIWRRFRNHSDFQSGFFSFNNHSKFGGVVWSAGEAECTCKCV
jgi:hypothetical protein